MCVVVGGGWGGGGSVPSSVPNSEALFRGFVPESFIHVQGPLHVATLLPEVCRRGRHIVGSLGYPPKGRHQ